MKEELKKTDNVVETVEKIQQSIVQRQQQEVLRRKEEQKQLEAGARPRPKSARGSVRLRELGRSQTSLMPMEKKSAKAAENKRLIEAFQKRDFDKIREARERKEKELEKQMRSAKSLEAVVPMPPPKQPRGLKSGIEQESTLLRPTLAFTGKMHLPLASTGSAVTAAGDTISQLQSFPKTSELETRLLQLETIPKLGQPQWRSSSIAR